MGQFYRWEEESSDILFVFIYKWKATCNLFSLFTFPMLKVIVVLLQNYSRPTLSMPFRQNNFEMDNVEFFV
jgi:hypothetical protein